MINMEKIDYVISVTGADYETVREALLNADGNVDLAIGYIMGQQAGESHREENFEEKKSFGSFKDFNKDFEGFSGKVSDFTDEIIEAIREIIKTGNATKLIVTDGEDREILSISLTLGAVGAVLAPYFALLGAGVGILSKFEFYVHFKDGRVVNVKDYIKNQRRMR